MKNWIVRHVGMLCFGLFVVSGCNEKEFLPPSWGAEGFRYYLTEADYNSENTYFLLNDEESPDVFFDAGQRSFRVTEPLQVVFDDNHDFRLRFYSPRALKDVTVWAKIDGYDEEFRFMVLEKVLPFQQLTLHIPFATEDLETTTRSGKKIRIMANPHLAKENITFTVESTDPYWACLKSIRCKWNIRFREV